MTQHLLLDTSVATRVSRPEVRAALRPLVHRLARTHMTDLEIGYSARSRKEWAMSCGGLVVFPVVELLNDDLVRALEVQRELATLGRRGRKIPDLLIAAVAERTGRTVLHYDRDFAIISEEVTGQDHQWILPAGSID